MKEPIDYNSPLGVSKREWAKVLGANLALLIIVYAIALICTLCGSNLFLLNFHSDDLQRIEETLRGWGAFAFVTIGFSAIEATIIGCYVAKARPRWWATLGFYATYVAIDLVFMFTTKYFPPLLGNGLMIAFWAFCVFALNGFKPKETWWIYLCRFAIALVVMFILNGCITMFRTKVAELWNMTLPNSIGFVLNVEYDLALVLALGFLTLAIPWKRKGGSEQCLIPHGASGSSPNTTNSSPKNLQTAKTSLSPKIRKRLRWLKVKVIAIQTISFVVVAALPWFTGRPVEFALVYASFCITRLMLGFNRSLHFKSELSCVTLGALCFWALTFLTPSAEASIILSLCYGAGLALGFRLWWELHDLIMYKKAAKTDRYAMLYVAFKGNVDPRHVNGVMRSKGHADKDEIKMVQMYMAKEKVEYIAEYFNFAKITIEKKLTEIATDLYSSR